MKTSWNVVCLDEFGCPLFEQKDSCPTGRDEDEIVILLMVIHFRLKGTRTVEVIKNKNYTAKRKIWKLTLDLCK